MNYGRCVGQYSRKQKVEDEEGQNLNIDDDDEEKNNIIKLDLFKGKKKENSWPTINSKDGIKLRATGVNEQWKPGRNIVCCIFRLHHCKKLCALHLCNKRLLYLPNCLLYRLLTTGDLLDDVQEARKKNNSECVKNKKIKYK
ncbi:hypothetical protein RFI_32822 [Reticulomyxa filosa]|uniref:Uncharacterized protein n=1 Tax=Reticulomyxa filosa TaxID=46433 RepID=X6LV19_RETFI|nr:hypothetical protein RFI_32822 [Reticulomyxa filosa]|eukprot:ETO04575.1 hypothetical protein RFI_32822 [Reticulomyxa filosa]